MAADVMEAKAGRHIPPPEHREIGTKKRRISLGSQGGMLPDDLKMA